MLQTTGWINNNANLYNTRMSQMYTKYKKYIDIYAYVYTHIHIHIHKHIYMHILTYLLN